MFSKKVNVKMSDDLNAFLTRTRLYSGIILFFYAMTHLLNHSINVFSLEAATYVKENYFRLVWKSQVGTILLYGSFLTHVPLGIMSIVTRKSFKISLREWLQIIFIILAVFVLVQHIASMYIFTRSFESELPYSALFSAMLLIPEELAASTVLFSLMTIFIWVHGSIGMHTALKFKMKSYSKHFKKFMAVYLGVPTLGLFGFWAGLKEQSLATAFNIQAGDTDFLMSVVFKAVPMEAFPVAEKIEPLTLKYYPIFLIAVVGLAVLNVIRTKYFGRVKITYPDGKIVNVPKGTSVLEASRSAGLPHKSVCGGRGRCTTCRIKVVSYEGQLPEAGVHEARALNRVGLDGSLRLACQLKPSSNLVVTPLISPKSEFDVVGKAQELSGKEQETVILFVDLRNFTKLSENNLPYDVVYILNKYYATCGQVIEANSGRLDKFIGDGIMAIFEAENNIEINCGNAVKAASEISKQIKRLSDELSQEFSVELKCGMGIHTGQSIVGMMGYGEAISRTAIGDNVNVASRLEQMTKAYNSELIVSKLVAEKAALDISEFFLESVEVRGRNERLDIVSIVDASSLQFN
jgi:adenylate cyclase